MPSEKQYKTQIKKWNLDTKYTKRSEYLAMIRIKRRREREDPTKKTRFILHGRAVDEKDIVRFEKRAVKNGLIGSHDEPPEQGKKKKKIQFFFFAPRLSFSIVCSLPI